MSERGFDAIRAKYGPEAERACRDLVSRTRAMYAPHLLPSNATLLGDLLRDADQVRHLASDDPDYALDWAAKWVVEERRTRQQMHDLRGRHRSFWGLPRPETAGELVAFGEYQVARFRKDRADAAGRSSEEDRRAMARAQSELEQAAAIRSEQATLMQGLAQ